MIFVFDMDDEDIKNWQRSELKKSRIENLLNQVIETYRAFEEESSPTEVNSNPLQNMTVNSNPLQNTYNLEESAITMAINEHGLQRNSVDEIGDNTLDESSSDSSYNLDESHAISVAINAHGLHSTEQ